MTISLCTAALCLCIGNSMNWGEGGIGSQHQGLAPGTHSALNHHLIQVFADVGKHWPLVWFLLPALQH